MTGRIAHLKHEGEEELLDQRERKNCSTNGRGRIARPTGEEELLDQRERKNASITR